MNKSTHPNGTIPAHPDTVFGLIVKERDACDTLRGALRVLFEEEARYQIASDRVLKAREAVDSLTALQISTRKAVDEVVLGKVQ